VLAIIVDDSGSNEAPASTCTGCPTDPNQLRVQAVKHLATTLLARAPRWRVALFDFGAGSNGGLTASRLLAGYTSYPEDLVAGAGLLTLGNSTYIYDSLADALGSVAGERLVQDAGARVPGRILLLTDGEDTSSETPLEPVLARAIALNVGIDTLGYFSSADGGSINLSPKAFRDLRRIAAQTGGVVSFLPSDALSNRLERLAEAYVGGYATQACSIQLGQAVVEGVAGLGGSEAPFQFEVVP
jgi:hypothetical protein